MTGEKEKETNPTELQSKPLLLSDRSGQASKPKPKILKKSSHNNPTKVENSNVTKKRRRAEKKKKIVPESNVENNGIEKDDKGKRIEECDNKNAESQKPILNLRSLQTKKVNWKKNKKPSGLDKLKSRKHKEKGAEAEMNQRNEKNWEKLGGLIFMCSAKTKPDCFLYNVMGVPMSQKELVLRVRPGLKLFLYDFDLRLMYGIYEASSSGGLKLEPTAFSGAFPVQVRFRVHEDCYPLTENVFRKAIKENYNQKHKFENQLTVEQVNKLVKLFQPVKLHSKALAIGPQPIMNVQKRDDEVGHYSMQPREDHQRIPHREIPQTDELRQNTFLTEQEYRAYGLRGERPNLSRLSTTDPHSQDAVGRYCYLPAHEDGCRIPYKESLITENGDLRQTTFLTEEEYRTYGLRRERPNLTPPASHTVSGLEVYQKGVVREDLSRKQSAMYTDIPYPYQQGEPSHYRPVLTNERGYRDYCFSTNKDLLQVIPSQQGEPSRHLPLLMNDREYQHYDYGTNKELSQAIPSVTAAAGSALGSYPTYQQYSSQYGCSYVDPYSTTSRRDRVPSSSHTVGGNREAYPVETNHLSSREIHPTDIDRLRRGSDGMDRLYSIYASRELSDNRNTGAMSEPSNAPVSSRYSFAGPSLSYR